MDNCRAGLYTFASTTAWLRETGMASPPLLVILGLTLPDSRILSGIASVGLTLANIAIILPHLRQPILDGMHVPESALAHEPCIKEETRLLQDESSINKPVDLSATNPVLASGPPQEREHSDASQPADLPKESEAPASGSTRHSPSLVCSAATRSVYTAETEPPGCLNEVAPQTTLPPPVRKIDDAPSLDAESQGRVCASRLFARKGRSPLYIPLPVPDAEEVEFFDASSERDLAEHVVPEEHSVTGYCGSRVMDTIGQDSQLSVVRLPSTQSRVELSGDFTSMTMPVADQKRTYPPTVQNPLMEGAIPDFPGGRSAPGVIAQTAQVKHSLVGEETLAKRRPESLEFIPQSVLRRYPSAPIVSAGGGFGHPMFNSGDDHQSSSAPPAASDVVCRSETLLQGTGPRASYTTLEGHCDASFLTPTKRSMVGNDVAVEGVARDAANQRIAPALHEASFQKHPTHRRRLGVLARAALRDRRSAARKRMDDGNDNSSASDSDSDSDSDSQYSSGSSDYENMLPHMLGADLIAAIDANSESELNLLGSTKTKRAPLNAYEDFLISEDSAADVMQVSSNGDTSDGEDGTATTFRSLTYEDIQQWAIEVVQKCVRQVCRDHVTAEPSTSPAWDVCAERPSGSGASQCPLSGLHCKLGAAASAETPAPGTKQAPVSLPATSSQPGRKPLQARNLRDIPEFVPRQRRVSALMGGTEDPWKDPRRSGIDATRDAATQVIARMENQARFDARQRLMGTEGKRMVRTTGGQQGVVGCA